jgi:NADH-quinone oxidoreductase subunit K
MLLHQITINTILFTIGLCGILLNYGRVLISFIALELMLLSAGLNFIIFSVYLNDFYGQIFSIFILTVAASESAVGLALLIIYYKIKGNIDISLVEFKKG